ncbi:WD40-repeat-containing domain protein [Phakopsora pachyrhizi]|uniref:WD40-repeat-containing domain protein n=1 Tax=Phakopsora pachyrhizi TaxID=170000 RepID=A0AAV0BK54_PHAPC|nr:WD40-repeat-containing domain protein [Phakopsora pachyrhizi]CAH7686978.1 WD40-repeat-containing domain protein [Phakopsora pachyrhizi]
MSLDWFQLYRDRAVLDNRWKDGKQKPSSLKGHTDSIYCVQFNGDQMLITGSRDRTIKLWDLGTGECTETLRGHQGSVLCLRVDGSRIISGSSDCRIIQWAPKTCEVSQKNISYEVETEFIGHGSGVLDLAMNEKVIISCSKDMTIKVWDRLSNKLIRTITGHHGPVNALQLLAAQFPASSDASKGSSENNPTTTRFISASGDSSMKLWELETGKCLRVFEGHLRGLACVKLVEELGLVISGSKDENIKIWDLNTGRCMKTLIGHEGLVRTLDVDVAQKRLVTGSYDKTIKVWDLSEGSLILDFRKQGNRFKSLVFDLKINCNKIVSVGHDSSIVVVSNLNYPIS